MLWRSALRCSTAQLRFCPCKQICRQISRSEYLGVLKERFLAIVNPAAGGGRSLKQAGPAIVRLRKEGLHVDVIASTGPGHAAELAREAYQQGYRRFIAVGGDGTAHEILNGVLVNAQATSRISLGFLPLGTGNSFLRDFAQDGPEAALQALLSRRKRTVDLLRLVHSAGELYSFNLLRIGFTADVAVLANRRFKPLGAFGYLLGVFARVVQLRRRAFALRCDDDKDWDRSEEHTSELQSPCNLVCRLLLEKKKR